MIIAGLRSTGILASVTMGVEQQHLSLLIIAGVKPSQEKTYHIN
jgi:hypothetical protein